MGIFRIHERGRMTLVNTYCGKAASGGAIVHDVVGCVPFHWNLAMEAKPLRDELKRGKSTKG